MPRSRYIVPCLPISRPTPPAGEGWLHEADFNGWRVQLHKGGKNVRLYGRDGYDRAHRLPGLSRTLAGIANRSAVIDGELVADNSPHERPKLHTLYEREEDLCIWAFDLLNLNGRDLRPLPLIERKKRLSALVILSALDCLQFAEGFNDPERLLALCDRPGLEGIISKRLDAPYGSGKRPEWVKVRCTTWREARRARPRSNIV